jgi:hypothetical protein
MNSYTAPIYIANLALAKFTKLDQQMNWQNAIISFKVLEVENEMDVCAVDSYGDNESSNESIKSRYSSNDAMKLIELRKKKLFEKAEHLLGRSYRNSIRHSKLHVK